MQGETDRETGPKGRSRHHGLRLYRTEGGAIVVQVMYWTTWPEERDRSEVYIDDLRSPSRYDPCGGIVGYPPGPQFAERQARLMAWHRAAWAALVSEVLISVPDAAEVLP